MDHLGRGVMRLSPLRKTRHHTVSGGASLFSFLLPKGLWHEFVENFSQWSKTNMVWQEQTLEPVRTKAKSGPATYVTWDAGQVVSLLWAFISLHIKWRIMATILKGCCEDWLLPQALKSLLAFLYSNYGYPAWSGPVESHGSRKHPISCLAYGQINEIIFSLSVTLTGSCNTQTNKQAKKP